MPQLDIVAYMGEYMWLVVAIYLLQVLLVRGVIGDIQKQGQIRGKKEKGEKRVVEDLLIAGVRGI